MGSRMDHFTFVHEGKLNFYCPLCHFHQGTKLSQKIGWREHLQIFSFTAFLTYLFWSVFDIKGAFFYLVVWSAYELQYRFRKRHALICENCGFDPFLYKQDVKKARAAVRNFWEKKIEAENLFTGIKLKNYKTNAKEVKNTEPVESNASHLKNNAPERSIEVGTS